ncbi:MAG: flagellar hook-length control protein FliK [Acidimicrobiaceae bacterium]|nr:flagellar hook-length control protein FliK [Acidimicrobiaceae bacterium]
MITLPLSPPPTKGGAPSTSSSATSDGTEPGLADVFASLVASMVNPQLISLAPTDLSPADTTPSSAITSVTATGPSAAATIASPTDGQSVEGEPLVVAEPATTSTTADTAAPTGPSASAPAAVPAAAPAAADLAGITATASRSAASTAVATIVDQAVTSPTDSIPVAAGPALSAATVLGVRRPATGQTDAAVPAQAETEADAEVTATTAKPTAAPAAPVKDDLDVDTNHLAVAHQQEAPTGIADVSALHKTKDVAPAASVMPHQQVAAAVSPLRRRPDGSYRLTLHLKPEHLGGVDLEVDLHHGTIDLHVSAEHEHARELLVDHLDELKAELEQAGLRAGSLDISSRQQAQQQQQENRRTGSSTFAPIDTEPVAAEPIPVASTPSADAAVDLQL